MYTSNLTIAELASKNRSHDREPERLLYIYRTMTTIVKAEIERALPHGHRLLKRIKISSLISFLLLAAFVGYSAYLALSFFHFPYSGWLAIPTAFYGTALLTAFLIGKTPLGAASERAFDVHLKDSAARITNQILQAFPERKLGHIDMDYLQLWTNGAFYAKAPAASFLHPSQYSYLLVSSAYRELTSRRTNFQSTEATDELPSGETKFNQQTPIKSQASEEPLWRGHPCRIFQILPSSLRYTITKTLVIVEDGFFWPSVETRFRNRILGIETYPSSVLLATTTVQINFGQAGSICFVDLSNSDARTVSALLIESNDVMV